MDEKKFESVDESRRDALRKMVASGAFVVPFVTSYAMSGVSAAASSSSTLSPTHSPTPTPGHTSPTENLCFTQFMVGSVVQSAPFLCPPGVTPGSFI